MEKGAKLAMAREYHRPALTQGELASMLGVPRSTLARWESQNSIPARELSKASTLLRIPESWFNDGGDAPPPDREQPNIKVIDPATASRLERMISDAMLVAVPVWRGVMASGSEEMSFVEPDEPEFREIPGFYTVGAPERHVLGIAAGTSMAPRINQAEQFLVRLDPDVPPGHLVVVRSPDQRNFVKRLTQAGARALELHSINGEYPPITEIEGWQIKGGVVMIRHHYEPGVPNIEWDEGRFLRG